MKRMRDIMNLVEELKIEMKLSLMKKLKNDTEMHKDLLRKLLLQGLIKLMEANVKITCREQDV